MFFCDLSELRAVETDREMEEADKDDAVLERNVVDAESRDETAGKMRVDSCVSLSF